MNENIILDVRHLRKGYKKYPVLKDVSFQIKQGHILGLIGKNGAGKTTLMKSKQNYIRTAGERAALCC